MNIEFNNIILVSDSIEHTNINIDSSNLEKPSLEYESTLTKTLNMYFTNVYVCRNPKELSEMLKNQSIDIVMTIYGGELSRNRLGLIPAICESYNIPFMGADVYSRMVCQDKDLAKKIVRDFKIDTSNSILINYKEDIRFIQTLSFPLVIKPNFEGSSIGISNINLVYSLEEATKLAQKLLITFKQSILVEEFIPGKEVNIIITGNNKDVNIFEMVEDVMIEDEKYFDENIFSLENKKIYRDMFTHKIITDRLKDPEISKFIKLYQSLKKIDYMRIDGKWVNNKFVFIELTSDPHLGLGSSFIHALHHNNYTYEDGIKLLVDNCLEYYQTQSSNVLNY